ncbi:MAG: DUF87 domain-containing protein [Treponema sp.]|nr:DUF87 domain-containing protein [Treponema sp.]
MGVLLEKIKAGAMKKYEKAGDKLAKLSKLTPGQIEDLQEKRDKYLSEMPAMDDEAAIELTVRLMAASSVEVFNSYLEQVKDVYLPEEFNAEYNEDSLKKRICYFDITKWVSDKKENSLEKLVNVYQVLEDEDCNIALVFRRTAEKCFVYLGVLNSSEKSDPSIAKRFLTRIGEAIKGNFPGSQIGEVGRGVLKFLSEENNFSIATISNVPSEKSEKFISQTIEKLLDGIVPESDEQEYTLVLLATPIHDVETRKARLGDIYTGLAPYSSWQTSYTFNESDATNALANFGVNVGVSAGVQAGRNQGTNSSTGTSDSTGTTNTDSSSDTNTKSSSDSVTDSTNKTDTTGSSDTVGGHAGAGVNLGIVNIGGGANYNHGWSKSTAESVGKSIGKTVGESAAKTVGKAVANSVGHAITNTVGKYAGTSQGVSAGANVGANFARSSSITATVGCNESITQSFTNFNIKHLLENLEKQMERMDVSSALGMWDFAAYVVSKDNDITNNVAHMYEALTQGEDSFMSHSAINTWRGDISIDFDQELASDDDLAKAKISAQAKEIFKYVRSFQHPVFSLSEGLIETDSTFLVYPLRVTPTTALSGKELAYSLNFPAKSVSGLPVLECASFGRNVSTYDLQNEPGPLLNLGCIFHMNHEENLSVKLDSNSLTSHVFITGSTGSGKSNTVYQLLNEAKTLNKNFLVIEPAKGEYKKIFGNMEDVSVYGTNPNFSDLLKLNPFSFPKEIHILEHLDRLVEIFNVCWPMYAAMPAVLKEAIEKSYEDAGWDLTNSTNPNGVEYPTFADIAQNIKIIIDTSEYDAENKGAYKGSLLTRLNSLTNGLNGQIFTAKNTISDADLFDKNVIIDLSRVGSQETKSLLMGILVLKLQEYRMAKGDMNAKLKHITVLEEAHNLLKRTSTEQSAESANLAGKSVEMLTNAIAEMRTYGEGFIIADQAPALLDMAVIRNTNTKIIMRLPDLSDRELVGKAANLNEDQIIELAKLPRGVAAVYQNEWVEAVLCKVNHFKTTNTTYDYTPPEEEVDSVLHEKRIHIATLLSMGEKLSPAESKKELDAVNISYIARGIAAEYLQNPPTEPRMTKLAPVMAALFPKAYTATKNTYAMNQDNPALWTNDIVDALNKEQYWIDKQNMDQVQRDIVQALVTQYVFNEIHQAAKLEEWTKHHGF